MFSRDFLSRMAQQYQLTPEQQDVLLLRFSSERKSYQEIAEILETSVEGIYKRASLIYEKFGIEGDSRGKEHRLRSKLREIQSPTPQVPPENQQPPQDPNLQQNSVTLQYSPKNFTYPQGEPRESLTDAVARLQEVAIALQKKGEDYVDHALHEITTLLPAAIAQVSSASKRTRLEITIDVATAIATTLENAPMQSMFNQAEILDNAGDPDTREQALEDYNQAIALNDEYAPAHYKRGLIRATTGVRDGLKDMEKALRLEFLN